MLESSTISSVPIGADRHEQADDSKDDEGTDDGQHIGDGRMK